MAGVVFWCIVCPVLFNKVIKPIITFLRQNNTRISPFVDDFLLMLKTSLATDHTDFTLETLDQLGWAINWEKCNLNVNKKAIFVGFEVTSSGLQGSWLRVLPSKIRKLRNILHALENPTMTARYVAKITGQCVAMTKAIAPSKLLLQNIYRVLSSRDSWDSLVTLTEAAKEDLRWWLSALKNWNRAPLHNRSVDLQISNDASSLGWGGVIDQDQEAFGTWNKQVSYKHSNYRELLAV